MTTLKVPVSTQDPIQGNPNSPLVLVEYGDFQCPYCGMAHPIVKLLQKHYGERLCFVFRHFPLTEIHPFAEPAAEAAECAAEYEKFWPMHDLIYENQLQLSVSFLLEIGKKLEVPVVDLEYAIINKKYEEKIKKDFIGGVRSGVNGTPTFFINNQRYNGLVNFRDLVTAMDAILES